MSQQLQLIDYLGEENRVLPEPLGQRRIRFNDDQRRILAARAKGLGSKLLREVATIVTPRDLLASLGCLMTLLGILLGLAGLVAPIIVDAHHWWLRKAKMKKTEHGDSASSGLSGEQTAQACANHDFSRYMLRFRLKCYEKDVCGCRFG